MNFKGFISAVVCALIIAGNVIIQSGCANPLPPSGGPRDSIPPVLLEADPADSTRNFSGTRITLTFDEFIDVQNVYENLIISPLPKTSPTIEARLKTVNIRIKDTLEPNTTYSLNFGSAIKDYTEGNPIKNFTYTFSTGSYIDSLELSGKVILAETGKTDTTLIVMLHTSSDDSAVIHQRPRYVTRLDGKGSFVFKNLPPRNFYLYALKDEGGTRRYLDDKQLFAFTDSAIIPGQQKVPVTLYAYSAAKSTTNTNVRPSPGGPSQNRLNYEDNLSNGLQDLTGNFELLFETPLKSFDSSKIRLYSDTIYTPELGYRFEKDSANNKIILTHKWKENTFYHVIMQKDFAEDTAGKQLLKTDTLHFATRKLSDYGSLRLKLRNLDLSRNPVLQFVVSESLQQSFPLTSENFSRDLFLPGDYQLRILFDANKNGIWDPGEFFEKNKQPETVKPIDRRINIKPNWQNEFEIIL